MSVYQCSVVVLNFGIYPPRQNPWGDSHLELVEPEDFLPLFFGQGLDQWWEVQEGSMKGGLLAVGEAHRLRAGGLRIICPEDGWGTRDDAVGEGTVFLLRSPVQEAQPYPRDRGNPVKYPLGAQM